MEVGDLLKQSPLFAELSDGDIDILARSTRMETYRTGQAILREGRVGAAFFVLLSGRVEVVKGMGTAESVVVATFRAGDFLSSSPRWNRHSPPVPTADKLPSRFKEANRSR